MDARLLGRSALEVSRVILGCGNFGGVGSAPELFGQGESENEAFRVMDAAWELGITTFDTADAYGGGRSESAIGRWLASRGHPATVATKVFHSVEGDPADHGLAPERIRRQIDGSLERLGVERVDLYLIHEPDRETPVTETLGALDELVRVGKVGAIGASNVAGAELGEALRTSAACGLARFECVQNSYSLLDREAERDVLPLCAAEGVGFTAFSPLAGGWLTGKYQRGSPYPAGSRMTLRPEPYLRLEHETTYNALERLEAAAQERRVETAALALAWLLAQPEVTAVVIGPRRPEHLEAVRAALELELSPGERDDLAAAFP
jgi:aryl-alcohol dehydrogenase-like predicted oxidoreductase